MIVKRKCYSFFDTLFGKDKQVVEESREDKELSIKAIKAELRGGNKFDAATETRGFGDLERKYKISFEPSLFKYISLYSQFNRSYFNDWYSCLLKSDVSSKILLDADSFHNAFLRPDFRAASGDLVDEEIIAIISNGPCLDPRNICYFHKEPRNGHKRYEIFWGGEEDTASGTETLAEILINNSRKYKLNPAKFNDPADKKVVTLHNSIIDKYIKLVEKI